MKIFYFLFFFLIGLSNLVSAQTKNILFIGNSYTGVNDLPGTFYNLALSAGDTVNYDSSTPGGYTFQMHSTYAPTVSKIYLKPWDYVVLQEQSQLPSFDPTQVAAECYPYARILDSLISDNDSCTHTVFYMTWGRKYGDASNCAAYPPVCTFLGMGQRLRESYLEMGDSNRAEVAPVGMAWRNSVAVDPSLELFQADYSHPSVAGTYLTACVFYATIYRKTPVGLSFINGLAPATATFLQDIAFHTVFDSLSTWNIGEFDPIVNFNYSINNTDVQFTDNSNIGDYHYWDFGDATSSIQKNPFHNYATYGTYSVKKITGYECVYDTLETIITLIPTSVSSLNETEEFSVFPNPANDVLNFHINAKGNKNIEIEIYKMDGSIAFKKSTCANSNDFSINLEELSKGAYFVKCRGEGNSKILKLIKL
ncbi:MAG: T9SS type A sorting domain-containing protein [Bacteroidetes bacterium]|nr:T9SS type A sorting domain-containing protein [Bacteroidota bacterium]